MDKNFVNALQKLITEQGKDVLLDVEKTKTLLSNYIQNEYEKERKLLLIAVEIGAAKEIVNASDLVACKKAQIRKLEENFTDESAAADVIDTLAFVLRGDSSKSIAAQNNTSAPTKKSNVSKKSYKIIGGCIFVILCLLALGSYVYYGTEVGKTYKLFKQAQNVAERGDYQVAVNLFSQAITINQNNSAAYNNRGEVYYKMKNYDQAIADYTKVIELNPKYALAYNNRGATYYELRNYNQAIENYTQAIELDPKNALYYNNRGDAYSRLSKNTQAIEDYTQAIALNPKYALAYTNRGNAYFRQQSYNKAIGDHTKAIADLTKAIADYTQAIELDPANDDAYFGRGSAYYALKNYDQALKDFTKANELNPKNVLYHTMRDLAYRVLQDYDQTEKDSQTEEDSEIACEPGDCRTWNIPNR